MKIVALTKEEFDEFAYKHKYSSYYQTSAYGETSRYEGLSTFYVGFVENGTLIGATLFLYKYIYVYYKYAYAPRGLLLDYTDTKQLISITKGLVKLLKKQHYAFVKIDPPIICSERDRKGNIIYFSNNVNKILTTLKQNGYKHQGFNKYFENYKPRLNAFVNLRDSIQSLYAKIDNDAKKILSDSEKIGIEIVQDKNGNIDELYKFVSVKNKRRKKRYYVGLYNNFKSNMDIFFINVNTDKYLNNMKKLYDEEAIKNEEFANLVQDSSITGIEKKTVIDRKMESDKRLNYYKNELVYATELSQKYPSNLTIGSAFTIKHNKGVELVIDSYTDEYLKFNPRFVLIWELIKKYKNEGYIFINLNAVVGEFNKEDYGIYNTLNNIKLKFNATVMEYIGEFDLIINERIYNKYKERIEKK